MAAMAAMAIARRFYTSHCRTPLPVRHRPEPRPWPQWLPRTTPPTRPPLSEAETDSDSTYGLARPPDAEPRRRRRRRILDIYMHGDGVGNYLDCPPVTPPRRVIRRRL